MSEEKIMYFKTILFAKGWKLSALKMFIMETVVIYLNHKSFAKSLYFVIELIG